MGWVYAAKIIIGILALAAIYEAFIQRKSALCRNFPLIGHFWFRIGGIKKSRRRPFNYKIWSWVLGSSKGKINIISFGSKINHNAPGTVHLLPNLFPANVANGERSVLPSLIGKVRNHPYQPKSFFNISSMNFGALSANAVLALSNGARRANLYLGTGDGGISPYHEEGCADLVFQLGPSKFGCRTPDGKLDEYKLLKISQKPQIKMIEIKLSQGAQPGTGSILPKIKITAEIAEIRGISADRDYQGPDSYSEFNNIPSLLEFIDRIQKLTGKPTGIKIAAGSKSQAEDLAEQIAKIGKGPDFIVVDGTESGTEATFQSIADFVGLPLQQGLVNMDNALHKFQIRNSVVLIASGKIATASDMIHALVLGADMVNIGRGFLFSLGCIQSMRCHTNHCPTGITTQNGWLQHGLDPTEKSVRVSNYAYALKRDLFLLLNSCGLTHPNQLTRDHLSMIVAPGQSRSMRELYPYPGNIEIPLKRAV